MTATITTTHAKSGLYYLADAIDRETGEIDERHARAVLAALTLKDLKRAMLDLDVLTNLFTEEVHDAGSNEEQRAYAQRAIDKAGTLMQYALEEDAARAVEERGA